MPPEPLVPLDSSFYMTIFMFCFGTVMYINDTACRPGLSPDLYHFKCNYNDFKDHVECIAARP